MAPQISRTCLPPWQRGIDASADRIPKAFAAEVKLTEDTNVDITVEGDTIVITPARREWNLDELVRKITPSNRHREISWGPKSGNETSQTRFEAWTGTRVAPRAFANFHATRSTKYSANSNR